MNNSTVNYLNLFLNNPQDINYFKKEELEYIEYCLTHQIEKETTVRDQWGNWDFPYTNEQYKIPYLDKYVLNIIRKKKLTLKTIWPDNKKFAICISHDVDFVTDNSITHTLRNFRKHFENHLFTKELILLPFKILRKVASKLKSKKDPLWCYEDWIEELQKYNFKSTFFFYVKPEYKDIHIFDCDYKLTDLIIYNNKKCQVHEMIKEIDKKGFEIGLHGSYNTSSNDVLLKKQKSELEYYLGKRIISTRQHWLHYDIKKTTEVHIKAELNIDSTLGFNRAIGFRAGTSFPYFLYLNEKHILEIPMHIMDVSLFNSNSLELNEEYAIKKSIEIMDEIEQVGGCLTLNFHPNYINNPIWWNTFKAIIAEANKRNAFNGTMLEIREIILNAIQSNSNQ